MKRKHVEEGEPRVFGGLPVEQNFGEMQHCCEMPRLQLQRASYVMQAINIASKHVIERGAFMPSLRKIGNASQQDCEARLCNVIALCCDVFGSELQIPFDLTMLVVHPGVPDAVLGSEGLLGMRA